MYSSVTERAQVLLERQKLKMAGSPHAYVRGNTLKFNDWLLSLNHGSIPEGPPVWICGDCHSGNLGPIADINGNIAVQIRDLDQTVIGNPAFDPILLGLSLATAARGSDLPGVTTARMLEHIMLGYEKALPKRSGEYLFEIIMRGYEVRSTIITSNRPIEEWVKLLGDVPAATAIFDRFLHIAAIVPIIGKSYRLKDRSKAKEEVFIRRPILNRSYVVQFEPINEHRQESQ